MDLKIPAIDKYLSVENIKDIFNFIIEIATNQGLNVESIKDKLSNLKPADNINLLNKNNELTDEEEISILYYNIPRLFEELLSAMGEDVSEIQSGTLIKDENLNKYIPAYLQSDEDVNEIKYNSVFGYGNMDVVPDNFADVFEISDKVSTKMIKDLPIGSKISLNIKGKPTNFIIVHHGMPFRHASEDSSYVRDSSPRYDDSVIGTWLLMENVWEDPDKDLQFILARGQNQMLGRYDTKRIIHEKYFPGIQFYSTFNHYFNTTFLNYFDKNIQKIIKEVNLPLEGNFYSSGTKKYYLDDSVVGFNVDWSMVNEKYIPLTRWGELDKNAEKEILIETQSTSLVYTPFTAKIFPLSNAEMNFPRLHGYSTTTVSTGTTQKPYYKEAPYNYTERVTTTLNGTSYYTYVSGTSGHDYIDGGYLKYFEKNDNFFDRALGSSYYGQSQMTDFNHRKATLPNGEKTKYNLRSKLHYNDDLSNISEDGVFLHYGPVIRDTSKDQKIYRFRPALILPFETSIKSEDVEISKYKYYAYRPSVEEWIERAKKIYNKFNQNN